jgi:signal transduction histidine kinase/ActR/RegA family two-component response regulator
MRPSWKPPAAAAATVLVAHGAVLFLLSNLHLRTVVSDLLLPMESLAATALFLVAAVRERSTGKRAYAAWLLLAAAQACIAGSELDWSVLEILRNASPFPSVGDIVYLLSYPTFFAGAFLLSPPSAKPGEKLRQLLDIGIIGLSAMLVLWVFLLSRVLAGPPRLATLLDGIGAMYLLGDIALVSTLIVLIFGQPSAMSVGARWFFAGSMAARIVADSLFAFQVLRGVSANGNASDAVYALSSLAAFCAALLQIRRPRAGLHGLRRPPRGAPPREDWRTHLPFLGILSVFFIFMWSQAHALPLGDVELGAWTGLIVLMSITRQALQGGESSRLRRELDLRVQQRTISLTEANLELFLLNKVRAAIAKELDLSVVLKTITEAVAETLGYSMVSLYLRDGESLVLHYEVGYTEVIARVALTQGVMGRVARTGAPVVVDDASRETDFLEAVPGVASEIAVPLLDHGVVEGVLSVESMRMNAFGESDLRLLSEVADYAAIAIVRARYVSLLRESQEQLERRVRERTSELQESQQRLRQAEKMEAIGRLAGGVAHDFNNMLMVIMGHGQMLLASEDLSPESEQEVEAMLESAERAAALTHQLLTFSRQQVIDVHALDLNAVIDGMSDMMARLVGEHVRLEIKAAEGLWPVQADRVQVEQVLLNLAANAADAMKEGGTLEIGTMNLDALAPVPLPMTVVPAGRYVVLTVRDSGEGMPAEVQQHVFEPFFTTKENGKGTGLGLATVYGVVRQARGFISLESAPGRGATFRIYLPAHEGRQAAFASEWETAETPGGKESILVVDDHEQVRTVTVLMLRSFGYSVSEAASGEEALALLQEPAPPPDLVITDLSMPDMTGLALGRQIQGAGAAPKVIFMSGYASDEFNHTPVDATFLQKPFTARVLARAVRKALDGSAAPA